MKEVTYECCVRLPAEADVPKKSKVYILVPDVAYFR
jgi:hypothetical protein